jgi:class 3 adenylate cyclase
MRSNRRTPWLALNNRRLTPALFGEDGPTLLNFPMTWTNKPAMKSTHVADAGRLVVIALPSSADLTPLVQELACLCQAVGAAYQRSQRLYTIIRPFLSDTTWSEAAEVARRGGHVLPTETRQASILWLDIASFTKLIDSHPLEQVLADLNVCLDLLTQVAYCHRGEVNKYLGDGFLAIFADADDAVQAGYALQQAAADFNRRQLAHGGLVFPTRVGIDSGLVTVTSLGSPERQDRTVIGMPVNLAERLQEKAVPGRVWLSQATFDGLRDQTGCRCLGPVKVKGRQEPVVVYEKR